MNYDEALALLGLTPNNCTSRNLKKAYAVAAKLHRPEHDLSRFAQIRQAYETVQYWLSRDTENNNDVLIIGKATDIYNINTNNINNQLFNTTANDPIAEQHSANVLALNNAWNTFVAAFIDTKSLEHEAREINQIAILNTLLESPALEHYLTRQKMAEQLGYFLLNEAAEFATLDTYKLALKSFDYENYGRYEHSWTLHTQLEAKVDKLREWTLFQLNAEQTGTTEQMLIQPISRLRFAKTWFLQRKRKHALKMRLQNISNNYPDWLDRLNPIQIWRVQHWPNMLVQINSMMLALFTFPILLFFLHLPEPNSTPLLLITIGFTLCTIIALALGYMTLWVQASQWIRPHLEIFNRTLNSANTDSTVQLTRTQQLYKSVRNTFTTTFFGRIEGIFIILLLSLWSWQYSPFTSKAFIQLYITLMWTAPLISFIYLKQLRKTQRILPNHPRSWAACLFIGLYALVANAGGNYTWSLVLLISIILRSQIPSFIHVDWGDTVPQLRIFEYFQIEERRAILIISGLSIGLFGLALTVNNTNNTNAIFHLSLQSLACLILYVWLTINANMDTPVMDITSRIFTAVFSSIVFISTIFMIKLFNLNSLTLELLIITGSICSMLWYWAYGYTQKHFVRWKPVSFEINRL